MPVKPLGKLSLTKFLKFSDVLSSLALIIPGQATANDVHTSPLLEPVWDDLVQYFPRPVNTTSAQATSSLVVQDDELLTAAREQRDDANLLLWCALLLADPRLDAAVREVFTDVNGRFLRDKLGKDAAALALKDRGEFSGDKPITNFLRNMVQAGIFIPQHHGGTIVSVDRFLPTAFAVPAVLRLIQDRATYWATDSRFEPAPGRTLDFALALGANHWLGLTRDEFLRAARGAGIRQQPTPLAPVPPEIAELADLLSMKRQVVLQGPPGTGKTHLATAYIDWATGQRRSESRLQAILDELPERERTPIRIADEVERLGLAALWDIVQFHPSYEYNDFVRTLAAQPVPGGVTFVAQHRLLSLIAAVGVELANRNSTCELVLVLDEINRGNIPSIFGELLYALEYRNQPVATAYSVEGDASITIPDRLKIIGTMNTADRSIAVIDYALRRRFVFLTVAATEQPIKEHPSYFDEAHRAAALFLFNLVREALGAASSGLQVGPSYYLPSGRETGATDSLRQLASRFIYEVVPLLNEYALEGEMDEKKLSDLTAVLRINPAASSVAQVEALRSLLGARTAAGSGTPSPVDGEGADAEDR